MMHSGTVFLVDDDSAVLTSLANLLQSQGFLTETYPSAREYLEAVSESRTGCLVLDLRMPCMSGLQLMQSLRETGATRPTIVISAYAEVESTVQAMKLGALDVLLKPFPPAKLVQIVSHAIEFDILARGQSLRRRTQRQRIEALSHEERQVLLGIVRGLTNQQIANELGVSLRTVQFRKSSLHASLDRKTKAELLAFIEEAGWTPA